jgi:hypothetical protein
MDKFDYVRVADQYTQPLIRQRASWSENVELTDQPQAEDVIRLAADGNRFVEGSQVLVTPAERLEGGLNEAIKILPVVAYFSQQIESCLNQQAIDFQTAEDWLRQQQQSQSLKSETTPMAADSIWQVQEGRLERTDNRYFSVDLSGEIPKIKEVGQGIVQLPYRLRNNQTEILVSFRQEPGNPRGILAPARQFSASNADKNGLLLNNETTTEIQYPSDFYQKTNHYQVGEVPPNYQPKELEQWVDLNWILAKMTKQPGLIGEHLAIALYPLLKDE